MRIHKVSGYLVEYRQGRRRSMRCVILPAAGESREALEEVIRERLAEMEDADNYTLASIDVEVRLQ